MVYVVWPWLHLPKMRHATQRNSTTIGTQPIRFIRQPANPGKPAIDANHRSNLETQGRKPLTTLYYGLTRADDGEMSVIVANLFHKIEAPKLPKIFRYMPAK